MDPSPGKPRDCHEIWNGRGQGGGGDLILHELGEKNVPGADAETRWSRDGEGRSWEWEFCPRGNSWWLRIPSAG